MEKRACGCGAKTKAKFNESLKKDAKAIVAKVEGLTKETKAKRSADIKAAFGEKRPLPKSAGISKGPHDGDAC